MYSHLCICFVGSFEIEHYFNLSWVFKREVTNRQWAFKMKDNAVKKNFFFTRFTALLVTLKTASVINCYHPLEMAHYLHRQALSEKKKRFFTKNIMCL